MHHRQVFHSPLLCPFSISSALSVRFAVSSVSAVPSCFSLWLIITDWLLLSPEGGHTVQLTSQAPGTQALPHISPLLLQRRDTRGPTLHLKRWASSCVIISKPFFLWWLEILSFRMEDETTTDSYQTRWGTQVLCLSLIVNNVIGLTTTVSTLCDTAEMFEGKYRSVNQCYYTLDL